MACWICKSTAGIVLSYCQLTFFSILLALFLRSFGSITPFLLELANCFQTLRCLHTILQIAYPEAVDGFAAQLLKVQDNIPICASIISQHLALRSLEVGPEWVRERVQNLARSRDILVKALAPLGEENVRGGQGAIYLWAKLPEKFTDDYEIVRWLVRKHHVVIIPGSASGSPGYVRISFGGLKEADCEVAACRLKKGLEELVKDGMVG